MINDVICTYRLNATASRRIQGEYKRGYTLSSTRIISRNAAHARLFPLSLLPIGEVEPVVHNTPVGSPVTFIARVSSPLYKTSVVLIERKDISLSNYSPPEVRARQKEGRRKKKRRGRFQTFRNPIEPSSTLHNDARGARVTARRP